MFRYPFRIFLECGGSAQRKTLKDSFGLGRVGAGGWSPTLGLWI